MFDLFSIVRRTTGFARGCSTNTVVGDSIIKSGIFLNIFQQALFFEQLEMKA